MAASEQVGVSLWRKEDDLDAESIAASWWTAARGEPVAGDRLVVELGDVRGLSKTARPALSQPVGNESLRSSTVEAAVCAPGLPWSCAWALEVAACESSGNVGAYNAAGPYVGLFQIWLGHLRPGGILEGMKEIELLAAEGNIRAAHSLYKAQGPGAWPRCGR